MGNYVEVKKGNVFIEGVIILILAFSMYLHVSPSLRRVVKAYTSSEIMAEIDYPKYTKENQATIRITGYNIKEVFWNGLSGRLEYTATLQEGENQVKITLVGKKETQEHEIVIVKDTKPPEMTDPKKESVDISESDIIILKFNEELESVKSNNQGCEQVSKDQWRCALEEGDNLVKFSDLAGNEVEKKLRAYKDREAPEILSEIPTTINQKPYTLTLKVSEDTVKAHVNGKEVEVKESSILIKLTQDKNDLKIELEDGSGNTSVKEVTIVYKEPSKQSAPSAKGGTPTIPSEPGNSGGEGTSPAPSGGEAQPPSGQCYSQSMTLYGIKTSVFVGETQMANILVKCTDTQTPLAGKGVLITVRYADGSSSTYSATTNGSGIASFSWTVPNKKGQASVTGQYGLVTQSLGFSIY